MNYSATQVYDVVSYTVSSRTNFLLEKKKKKKKNCTQYQYLIMNLKKVNPLTPKI